MGAGAKQTLIQKIGTVVSMPSLLGVILAEPQLAQIGTILATVALVAIGSQLFGGGIGFRGFLIIAAACGVFALVIRLTVGF